MTQDTPTIPKSSATPLEFKIRKILVPLDFSPASMEALDYAVWLAKQFRAAIHLVMSIRLTKRQRRAQDISCLNQPRRSNGLTRS